MTTVYFFTELFCRVDAAMGDVAKHRQAQRYPSAIVTFAVFFGFKGVRERALYRWVARDVKSLFPKLPERTRRIWSYSQARRAFTMPHSTFSSNDVDSDQTITGAFTCLLRRSVCSTSTIS